MIRKNQKRLNQLNVLSDGVLIFLSYIFASWLWLDVVRGNASNMAALERMGRGGWMIAVLYAVWTVFVLNCMSVYRRTRIQTGRREISGIVLGNLLSILTAAALLYVFRLEDFSRGVLAVFLCTSCALLLIKRSVVRSLLQHFRSKGYNQKHVVVVGSGELASRYVETVERKSYLGIRVD